MCKSFVFFVSDSDLPKRGLEFYFQDFRHPMLANKLQDYTCFLVPVPAISLFILARQQAAVVKTPLTLLLELGHPIQPNHDHLHLMVAKRGSLASPQDCRQYIVPGGGALDPAV